LLLLDRCLSLIGMTLLLPRPPASIVLIACCLRVSLTGSRDAGYGTRDLATSSMPFTDVWGAKASWAADSILPAKYLPSRPALECTTVQQGTSAVVLVHAPRPCAADRSVRYEGWRRRISRCPSTIVIEKLHGAILARPFGFTTRSPAPDVYAF